MVRRSDDGELVIRSDAGHDFCRFDQNWKMHAPILVRDSDELLEEIYPRMAHCDPEWMELREFYCPLSGRLLETEAVTPGYPVVHEFLPDIEGFYRGWLRREVPEGVGAANGAREQYSGLVNRALGGSGSRPGLG